MKIFYLIAVFLFSATLLFSQNKDTLLTIDEVTFASEFEEEAVKDFFNNGKTDYLKLFLASSGVETEEEYEKLKEKFTNFYSEINSQKLQSLPENKKIKTIYKSTHEEFFKVFEFKTNFQEIFKSGKFNCVTASALYGIILKDMDIPFEVRETPVHVYIVTYPKTHDIKIEATDPLTGYLVYDQRAKKQFVDYLLKNKLISEDEYAKSTVDDIFNKNFFEDKEINIRELLGLHYLNLGLYKIEDQKFKEGYKLLSKSYLFYPSEKIEYIIMSTLAEIVKDHKYDALEDLEYLTKICRFSNMITAENVRAEFSNITYNYLITRSNLTYYDEIYKYLNKNIENPVFKEEISFLYNYEKGRFLLNKGNTVQSHDYFSKAYFIKPDHSDAQTAFVHSLSKVLENLPTAEAVNKVETYYKNDSLLKKNDVFKVLLLNAYLVGAYENFSNQQARQGEIYLSNFETVFNENKNISVNETLIGDAYSSAGVFYFKKGNYARSKEYINKGLQFAPGNFKLIMSKNSF